MKLGLISDVHANVNPLKMALDILAGQKVDKILCAGDLVEKGPDGDAVVHLLRERDIPCVLGNHDEAVPSNQQWLREKCDLNHPNVRTRLLNETTITYLGTLPFSLRYTFEDKRILLVHGTPFSNVDYLFSNSAPEKFCKIAQKADADIIIFGHTHEPMQAFFDDVWFFNPGAPIEGEDFDLPRARFGERRYNRFSCATLTLPNCQFRVFNITTGDPIEVPYIC